MDGKISREARREKTDDESGSYYVVKFDTNVENIHNEYQNYQQLNELPIIPDVELSKFDDKEWKSALRFKYFDYHLNLKYLQMNQDEKTPQIARALIDALSILHHAKFEHNDLKIDNLVAELHGDVVNIYFIDLQTAKTLTKKGQIDDIKNLLWILYAISPRRFTNLLYTHRFNIVEQNRVNIIANKLVDDYDRNTGVSELNIMKSLYQDHLFRIYENGLRKGTKRKLDKEAMDNTIESDQKRQKLNSFQRRTRNHNRSK